jgi:alcohol dehydrogenase
VSDPGVWAAGLLDGGLASLDDAGLPVTTFTDVCADPPESIVQAAVESGLAAGCDGVIGLGGGSSMDTAKLVAVMMKQEQALQDMYGVGQVRSSRLPLIQVPTTAGTGSEVTAVAVVTTGETTKAGVVDNTLIADSVILDPALTIGLPAPVTASTGIDAMVHAIEAYTSRRLKNPVSDMLALRALGLLSGAIETAVHQGDDIGARGDMLFGAMLAGQAFANAPVAAVHALAYPLGGVFHIPHGLSNSLVLPHVLRFNAPEAASLYRDLFPHILKNREIPDKPEEATEALSAHFLDLSDSLGLPVRLSAVGIGKDELPMLADEAMKQQRLLINNPRDVGREDALELYRQAW